MTDRFFDADDPGDDPCFCGSRLSYKHCHGLGDMLAAGTSEASCILEDPARNRMRRKRNVSALVPLIEAIETAMHDSRQWGVAFVMALALKNTDEASFNRLPPHLRNALEQAEREAALESRKLLDKHVRQPGPSQGMLAGHAPRGRKP